MNKSDMHLKQDAEDELRWDPKINAAQIGVAVDKGAVSLTGAVDTYAEKWAAAEATKRVAGVRSVAEDLTVKSWGLTSTRTQRSQRRPSARSSGTSGCQRPSR